MVNKKAFSLIEVIVATSIITITVFGIYKLIAENNKIIIHSSHYLQTNSLFPIFIECIENKSFNSFTSTGMYSFYLSGALLDKCNTGTSDITTSIDDIDYKLLGEIISIGDNNIDWNLYVESDFIKSINIEYRQVKK